MAINLDDFKYLMEIAASSNISRAAGRLGISQPALTMSLKKIEEELGVSLFLRDRKGVTLTRAGRQLLSQVQNLIALWEGTKGQARAAEFEIQGVFKIGCHATVALHSFSCFLPQLVRKYENLEIKLEHDYSRKIREDVIEMKIDIGIVANPLAHPDLVMKKIFSDKVGFWASKEASPQQDPQSGEAILLFSPDLQPTEILLKRLKKGQGTFRRTISSSSLETIAQLVSVGTGIGILPHRVAGYFSHLDLQYLEHLPSYEDEFYLIYRTENKGTKALQAIAQSITQAFLSS